MHVRPAARHTFDREAGRSHTAHSAGNHDLARGASTEPVPPGTLAMQARIGACRPLNINSVKWLLLKTSADRVVGRPSAPRSNPSSSAALALEVDFRIARMHADD